MNTWGNKIRLSIFGESHGEAIGIVIDGLKAGTKLNLENINKAVKKSHAVFYISASPNPPQSGDKENSGTIEKIYKKIK